MASKDMESKPSFSFFLASSSSSSCSYKEMMKRPSFLLGFRFVVCVALCYLLWLRFLFYTFPPASTAVSGRTAKLSRPLAATCDPAIAPFYIHRLHPRFNSALVQRGLSCVACCDVCPHVGHRGLGRPLLRLPADADVDPGLTSWYATHPLAAEVIFHARAERHPCRTADPAAAELFYVPFFAGLHAATNSRQQNHTRRDALAVDLADHLASLPAFGRRGGRDHFLVVGRTSWDFMRNPAHPDSGANRLLLLPEFANTTVLTVERHPWEGRNQFGIPYPSYFHPRTAEDVADWQAELRRFARIRSHLFAFVGGLRPGADKASVRASVMSQCWKSKRCLPVDCNPTRRRCEDPDRVLDVMRRADFCLQPPGESLTRRSTFDAILAGCIPVFFSEHSAYAQYEWYLPARPEDWSVLLKPTKWDHIEEELAGIPKTVVEKMRETVIELIPKVTYAHPDSSATQLGFHDVVDMALIELTKRVRSNRENL
ncbi:putative xyloglucan galactosyltransferase GT17 [Curcuma longa]|uniref:putative xyloglucan galactosyltransferase GT17 n=1 Tax=Curcuma longa TaxID=136217 RepID=UPI003D9EB576